MYNMINNNHITINSDMIVQKSQIAISVAMVYALNKSTEKYIEDIGIVLFILTQQ